MRCPLVTDHGEMYRWEKNPQHDYYCPGHHIWDDEEGRWRDEGIFFIETMIDGVWTPDISKIIWIGIPPEDARTWTTGTITSHARGADSHPSTAQTTPGSAAPASTSSGRGSTPTSKPKVGMTIVRHEKKSKLARRKR